MNQYPVKWVRLERFCELTGWSEQQVRDYRSSGAWPDGLMTSVRGRRIHVCLPAFDEWVKTGRVSLAA